MSLVAIAARITTTRALMNATLAAASVHDSAIDPIDQKIADEAMPHIVVFTDDDVRTVQGRDLNSASRQLDLVIEIACAGAVMIEPPDGGQPFPAFEIPTTDAGLELTINLIERQTMRVLLSDQGAWPKLWRRIALAPSRITSKRGAGSEKGVRFAAHQIIITTETLSEPGFGAAPDGFWADFIAALEAETDDGLKRLAKAIRAEIESPTLPEWRRAMADLGVNEHTAVAIGIGPLVAGEQPAPLAEVNVAVENAPDWPLNAQTANDALGPAAP